MGDIPTRGTEVLQLPGLLCVIALFIYLFAYISYRTRGRLSIGRFLAHIMAIVGIWAGFNQVWRIYNPDTGFLYRSAVERFPKVFYAHHAALALPVALLLIFLVIDLKIRRSARLEKLDEDEDF
ncbi:hypothetical protein EON81_27965 [bacterium]|nr:MAG: hypothetical protein EON81_27965 [bacterium]